jgi:hypothetical protein
MLGSAGLHYARPRKTLSFRLAISTNFWRKVESTIVYLISHVTLHLGLKLKQEIGFQLRNNRLGTGLQDTLVVNNLHEALDMMAARYNSPGMLRGGSALDPYEITGSTARPLHN